MLLLSIHNTKSRKHQPVQSLRLDLDGSADVTTRLANSQIQKSAQKCPTVTQTTPSAFPTKCKSQEVFANPQRPTKQRSHSATLAATANGRHRKNSKRVSFSAVHVREHAVTVGDHDWCSGSLPLTLDWQHARTRFIGIDDYEWMRQRQGRTPRGRLPSLGYTQRKRLLRRVSRITEEDLLLMERTHIESKYIELHRSKMVTLFPGLEMEDPDETES